MKWFTDDFWFCSVEGEQPAEGGTPPDPASSEAAQAALKATEKPATLLTEEKPKEEAEPKKSEAPPAYDETKLTFPEGVTLDKEALAKFGEIAKAAGLSQPAAQQLVDLYNSVSKVNSDTIMANWNKTCDGWVTEVKADKEIGAAVLGDLRGLDAVKATVGKIIDNPTLTDPKFRESLEISRWGDNPAAIRTLYRWAKALTEGSGVRGEPPSAQRPRSAAAALYPNLRQTE